MIWRPPPPLPALVQHLQHIPGFLSASCPWNTRYIHSWYAFCTCAEHNFCMSVHFCCHKDRSSWSSSPSKVNRCRKGLSFRGPTSQPQVQIFILDTNQAPWLLKKIKVKIKNKPKKQTLISASSATLMALCTWCPATTHNQKHKFMLSTCLEENQSTKIFVRAEVPVRLQCPLWHHKVLIARTTCYRWLCSIIDHFRNTKKRKLSLMAPLKVWICKDQQPFKLWTCVFECIRRWQRTSHWHFSSTSGAGYLSPACHWW